MRRKFTREEFRSLIAGGKRLGVTYSKKEKRFMKKITFKHCEIFPDGMIMIDPKPSPINILKQIPGNGEAVTDADILDERILH